MAVWRCSSHMRFSRLGSSMMQNRRWAAIPAIVVLAFGFSIGSFAQEDSYRIMKLVRLGNGKAETVTTDYLVELRDSVRRDRTPEEGVKVGDEIILGRYVHCRTGISAALRTNNGEVIWMNSDTTVQIGDKYVKVDSGEVYTRAKGMKLELIDGTNIKPEGSEIYLKAGKEESFLYLFEGEMDLGQITLDERRRFARFGSGQIESFGSNSATGYIEERAKTWRGSIKRLTKPFWMKSRFYIPTAAVAAIGVATTAYFLTRKSEPGVFISIELP
jgi:hypothetical protein